jgi:Tol biopolymer transport system component
MSRSLVQAFLLLVSIGFAVDSAARQTTTRVSVDSAGGAGNGDSSNASISADGRFVVFCSVAENLVPNDTNNRSDVFVRDRATGLTERVSVDSSGAEGDDNSSSTSAVSADGRFVSFVSDANNLVPFDTNGHKDVFVRDRQSGNTERVSVDSGGVEGNADSGITNEFPLPEYRISMSSDGRLIAFTSYATNLVGNDTNGAPDVFVHE